MVWTRISDIKESNYPNSQLIYFKFHDKEKFSILTDKVLSYLKVSELNIGDEIFVIKTFNKKNKEFYLIKKVRKQNGRKS